MKYKLRSLGVLGFIVMLSGGLQAQTGTSVITGTITDASTGAIPGVEVSVTNQETGARQETITNETGAYRFSALPPGPYRIEASLVGFDRLTRGPITLQVSQTIAIDLVLQVGQIGQTVDVTEAAPLIESQTSDIGQAVTREMVAALPLPNRAASSLAALAPGVVMIDTGTGTAENYPVFSVAGGRARNQNFTLDGGQCVQRRRADAAAATHQPSGRCHAGVQGHRQQLFGRIWTLHRGHCDHGHALRYQSVSRQRVRIAAKRCFQCAQFLRSEDGRR